MCYIATRLIQLVHHLVLSGAIRNLGLEYPGRDSRFVIPGNLRWEIILHLRSGGVMSSKERSLSHVERESVDPI